MTEQTERAEAEPSVERLARVQQAQAGNQRAFALLAASYHAAIYALCLEYARNSADAEDLTQETFVKAHEHLHQLQRSERFGAWLMQIAANTCRNWANRERPQQMLSLNTLEYSPADARVIIGLQQSETRQTVQEALARLPVELRRAVKYVYLDGMTQNELAILWNMPHSTVKGRLDAARRLLRKELQQMEPTLEPTTAAAKVAVPSASVAIVDVDKMETREMRAVLKSAGFTCSVIGREALVLAHLRRHKSDILIVNNVSGRPDKHELLRALRQDAYLRDRAVMFLVPKEEATDADIFRAWTAGVDCYLTKPVVAAEIGAFVRRLDAARKSAGFCTLAIEYAWRQDTNAVLYCLQQALTLNGKDTLGNVRDDPAFNYLRHTPEFQQIMQDVLTPHEAAERIEADGKA